MKDLLAYLSEEMATPMNTMGAGNPSIYTDPSVVKPKKKKKK